MCGGYIKFKALLGVSVVLQRRRQKTTTREKGGQFEKAFQNYSMTIQKQMLTNLSLTNTRWAKDGYYSFSVDPLHVPHIIIFKPLREWTAVYLSS